MLDAATDARLHRILLRDAVVVDEDLDGAAIMQAKHVGGQVTDGVGTQIRREIADAQPPALRRPARSEILRGAKLGRDAEFRTRVSCGMRQRQHRIIRISGKAERRHGAQQRGLIEPADRLQQWPAALPLAQADPVLHHVARSGG